MKKLLVVGLMLVAQASFAGELRPQFRLWKSSDLGVGEFSNTQISSASIIFHMVVGSPTVNNGGDSYFVVHQSTHSQFASDSSTKAFIPLNSGIDGIGEEWNIAVSSHAFFSKRGGARVGYLWDWLGSPPQFLLDSSQNNTNSRRILGD